MNTKLFSLGSALALILFLFFICPDSHAQTVVTGANVTKFEASSIETQPKMMAIPLMADVSIIKGAQRQFKTKGTITLPEAPESKSATALTAYREQARVHIAMSIEELKAQALFEFSEATDADVIVSPMYSVVTESSNGNVINVIVKIKGYPAVYTNFRNATAADTTLVYLNNIIRGGKKVERLSSNTMETTTKEELEKK